MMDRTDYQILNLLQDDSRCTLRRMGDLVGLTPPAVSERIRRMEESGVIRGYHIDIDRTKLDCNITGFISVALEPDKYDKFCDFIQSETFADSIRERFPAYQNALETYVKQVLKDATCKK